MKVNFGMMKVGLLCGLVASAALACGGLPPSGRPEAGGRVARVHRARCGACHTRVEPGERTREELETALERHHNRVRLAENEWGAMVDYLAKR